MKYWITFNEEPINLFGIKEISKPINETLNEAIESLHYAKNDCRGYISSTHRRDIAKYGEDHDKYKTKWLEAYSSNIKDKENTIEDIKSGKIKSKIYFEFKCDGYIYKSNTYSSEIECQKKLDEFLTLINKEYLSLDLKKFNG